MKKNILKAALCFLVIAVCVVLSYFYIMHISVDQLEVKDKIVEEL